MRYTVYSANGVKIAETNSIEYSGEWMGERSVSLTINSPEPLDLTVGCFVIYRGEKFELNVDAAVQKQARIKTTGEAFVYESVKFNSLSDELTRAKFLDYVLTNDNEKHFLESTEFAFYCSDVSDLAERIQANLERVYGSGVWTVKVDEDYSPAPKEKNISVSVSNINCWEALALVNSEFDVNFCVEHTPSRTITIGRSGSLLNVMQFGKGNGLRTIKATTDSSQAVVTRLRARGNTTNMPTHYYYYKTMHCTWNVYSVAKSIEKNGVVPISPTGYYLIVNVGTGMTFLTRNESEGKFLVGFIFTCGKATLRNAVNYVYYQNGYLYFPIDFDTYISVTDGTYPMSDIVVELTKYIDKTQVSASHKSWDYDNPTQLLATNNVMLPGYPDPNKSNYIDSPNLSSYGIREESVVFDGSSEDYDDVYPTIEDMTMQDLEDAGYTTYIATEDSSLELKQIELDCVLGKAKAYDATLISLTDYDDASEITDDGVFDQYTSSIPESEGDFILKIRNIGFNLADADVKLSSTEYPVISMKDGSCGGREFNVVNCALSDDKTYYILLCEKVKDDSLGQYFPNKDFGIKAGDHFVLTNMYMPDVYVDAASARLKTEAEAWLAENDTATYKYEVEIDNLYMQRQHDAAEEGTSLHDTIKEGDVVWFKDTDLGIEEQIEIEKLSIKEDEKGIPTYSVTLNDEKTASTIQRIQNAISGIENGSTVVNSGLSLSQVKEYINLVISNLDLANTYLSKKVADTAAEDITFAKNIKVGETVEAEELNTDALNAKSGDTIDVGSSMDFHKATRHYDGAVMGDSDSSDDTAFTKGIKGCAIYWDGTGWRIETDYLSVNKKASFKEVEINKISHIGGQQLLTAASCVADHIVDDSDNGHYYIFFRKTDGEGHTVTNDWVAYDQAYCQTFNIGTGTTTDAKNKYYWVLVTDTSNSGNDPFGTTTKTDTDGNTFTIADFHWIEVSSDTADNDNPAGNTTSPCLSTNYNDMPETGDNIVLLGHQGTDTSRMGATILAGAGTWGQALIMWKKINSYILPTPDVKIGPSGVSIIADTIKFVSGSENVDVKTKFDSQDASLDSILEDAIISENEKLELTRMANQILEQCDSVDDEYSNTNSTDTDTAYNNYSDACSDVLEKLNDIVGGTAPIYLSDYDGTATKLSFSRTQLQDAISAYNIALYNWQGAYSKYFATNIGTEAAEQAKSDAIDYVNEHLDEVLDKATDDHINSLIQSYSDNKFVQTSTYEQDQTSLKAYTTWIDDVKNTCGSSGLFTYLDSLFVGTNSISFDANGNVININKSGLVTSTQFAALQSTLQDPDGNTITSASIAAYVRGQVSYVDITADQVHITSGSKTLHDYFSLNNGNLWCQNITVEGVINNLINTIDVDNSLNADKVISEGANEYSLDILCLGDVIKIKSLPSGNLNLPYYINTNMQHRNKTKNNGTVHDMTPAELQQLIGRKITIFVETSGSEYNGLRLKGCMTVTQESGINIFELINNQCVLKFPDADNDFYAPTLDAKVLTLEFKSGIFRSANGKTLFQGYYWVAQTETVFGSDIEDDWVDEE